jgi:hypothetical protein
MPSASTAASFSSCDVPSGTWIMRASFRFEAMEVGKRLLAGGAAHLGLGPEGEQTAGRSGLSHSPQRRSAVSWGQAMPAGLPPLRPGMGDDIDGARKQAGIRSYSPWSLLHRGRHGPF